MSHHGETEITNSNEETFTIRTKPCWICGQYSYMRIPWTSWLLFDVNDKPIELAWPEGSAEDKQLLRTGIHPKCWSEEFPTTQEDIT